MGISKKKIVNIAQTKLIKLNTSFGLVVRFNLGKSGKITYLKYDKSIKLKLIDVLFGYNEMEFNINLVILNAKMCISKFRYGTYFSLLLLFERELHLRNL